MSPKASPVLVVCQNRKARFRFEILQTLECGIALRGTEVKSLRERAASLDEAYARVDSGELWLFGLHIAPYSHAPSTNNNVKRRRKLLVRASELRKLVPLVDRRGFTLVPLQIYFNIRGIAKVELAVARGKKLADKRETMRTREHEREVQRVARRRG